ncbi:unnamed protein product [Amoebophrya sp. A25]|nr:unnamed protein product [Amoebophrya sp. A25]|eukprot:GSA25T00011256001.1
MLALVLTLGILLRLPCEGFKVSRLGPFSLFVGIFGELVPHSE